MGSITNNAPSPREFISSLSAEQVCGLYSLLHPETWDIGKDFSDLEAEALLSNLSMLVSERLSQLLNHPLFVEEEVLSDD